MFSMWKIDWKIFIVFFVFLGFFEYIILSSI